MRMIRTVGACAVALALCGAGATSASAAEYPLTGLPEIGRCLKVTAGTGHFNTGQCLGVDKDGNDGSWEWKPGPGEHGTFKIIFTSVTFETVGGNKINCTNGQLTGEYTNGKGLKVSKTLLQGCVEIQKTAACSSQGVTEKGIIESTQTLVGEIGFIPNTLRPENPYVGADLKAEPEGSPLLTFTCGELPSGNLVQIEGSVIGKIRNLNKMLTENGFAFAQKKGVQKPEAFKGGVKDTLTESVTPLANPLGKHSEAVGLAAVGPLNNGEPIEFKAKQH
jgi:hypothetical protein